MKILKEDVKKTYRRDSELTALVANIIGDIVQDGDKALLEYSARFDGTTLQNVVVPKADIEKAYTLVGEETIAYLRFAAEQIAFYAKKQMECLSSLETKSGVEGVTLGHRLIPAETCGCYIPGGRYPLPSSALMSIIPAKIAGVQNVYACCPMSKAHGMINPAVLVAMDIAGADQIYCMGGAQAIAAYAYGTESVKKVDLIVGPGNRFVTEAKRQVLGDVGIDSLAGPSEVLVIADETSNPSFVAIDLLAQCEHDPNAKGILVSTSESLINETLMKLEKLVGELSTGETAYKAWQDNGKVILADSIDEAIAIANDAAPEHLEVQTKDEQAVAKRLHNYGSLFIGSYTPVTFGDYCSGTNHILPTMGTAKYSNGVWVGTFLKTSFYQSITEQGCKNLSMPCMHIAGLEGLYAHQKSVAIRVEQSQ